MFIYTMETIITAVIFILFALFWIFMLAYVKFDNWRQERLRRRLQKERGNEGS